MSAIALRRGCRVNPPWREFVVANSNDPWGDGGGRTEESQVATGLMASPEASLDFLQRLSFPDILRHKRHCRWQAHGQASARGAIGAGC